MQMWITCPKDNVCGSMGVLLVLTALVLSKNHRKELQIIQV